MKVTLVQQDIVWASPEANRRHLEDMLAHVSGTDLIVLPEMFSTGFATDPSDIAEEAPAPSLEWMKRLAREKDCAVAGSIALHEDGRYRNRFYFVTPDGGAVHYDKKHLFTYGGEHLTFTPGEQRVVVEWRGWRFLLLVCYDLRFPVWARSREDYDAIICVASWPEVSREPWDLQLRARAIENQCYVLGVDRTGTDPKCVYNGGTALVDPWGKVAASAPDGVECLLEAEMEKAALEGFRAAFPVLKDRD